MKKLLPILFIFLAQTTIAQIKTLKCQGCGGGSTGGGGITQAQLNDSTNNIRTDLGNAINLKLAIADTSAMLSNYATAINTNITNIATNTTAIATINTGLNGGTIHQVLTKNSSTNQDYSWATPTGGGGSVTAVTASAPLASSGGATPNISADTTTATTGLATKGDVATNTAAIGINTTNIAANTTAIAGKQNILTLTTTGSSGASTLIGATLNIPNYAGGGGATWGSITGTLSSQTDLQNALNLKYDSTQFVTGTFLNDFTVNGSGFTNYNSATSSYDGTNHWLAVTAGGSSRGVYITGSPLVAGNRYTMQISIAATTVPLKIQNYYGINLFTANSAGVYYYTFIAGATDANSQRSIYILSSGASGTFDINYLRIQQLPVNFAYATKGDIGAQNVSANTYNTQIGLGSNAYGSGSVSYNGQIVIGNSWIAPTETGEVIIGQQSTGYVTPSVGSAGGEGVGIGDSVIVGSWRGTAIGGRSRVSQVSGTALGYGAFSDAAHAMVLGRGGYNNISNSDLIYNGQQNGVLYLDDIYAKHFNAAMPGGGETIDNSGFLSAGTQSATIRGMSGVDGTPSPTLTNIPGGFLKIAGGQGTGTAHGGNVQLLITKAGGSSSNAVNPDFVAVDVSGVDGSLKFNTLPTGLTTDSLVVDSSGSIRKIPNNVHSINATGSSYDGSRALFDDGSWKTVSGSGTVTSVATGYGTLGGPITGTGTITADTASTHGLASKDFLTNKLSTYFQLPALTSGSVLFSNGTTIAQLNGAFFWDNSNFRLGIGTNTPGYQLDLLSSAVSPQGIRIKNTSTGNGTAVVVLMNSNASSTGQVFKATSGYSSYKNIAANDLGFYNNVIGNISILNDYTSGNITMSAGGASSPQFTLQTTGNINFLNLKTGSTAPTTSGTTQMVITDANGQLSFGTMAQTTLVAGTKAISITGVTTSSKATVSFVSIGGTVSTTWQYAIVCTSGTVTISALTNAGTVNTSDTSVLTYTVTP